MAINPQDHKPAAAFYPEMQLVPPTSMKSTGQFVNACGHGRSDTVVRPKTRQMTWRQSRGEEYERPQSVAAAGEGRLGQAA
jgi:hypothetical protein